MTERAKDITAALLQSLGRQGGSGTPQRRGLADTCGRASDDADPWALYQRYQTETSVGDTPGEAIRVLKLAAAAGSHEAQLELGNRYRRGDGVPQDLHASWNQYVTAARAGNLEAMTNLGVMYDQGQTVPPDPATACRCYRHAAERGFVVAQYNLAIMLAEGLGTERDQNAACQWFAAAASQGHQQSREALEWLQGLMASS